MVKIRTIRWAQIQLAAKMLGTSLSSSEMDKLVVRGKVIRLSRGVYSLPPRRDR